MIAIRRPRVFVAVLGLLALGSCEGRLEYLKDEKFKAQYTLPPGTHTLRVELLEGALTFEAGASGEVQIDVVARRGAVTAAGLEALEKVEIRPSLHPGDRPGVAVLRGPQLPPGCTRPAHRLILRTLVRVAPDIAVEGVTLLGSVAAKGRRSTVRLDTAHGKMLLLDCHGDAWLRTGRGTIIVDKHRGGLDIRHGVWQGQRVEERKGDVMQIFVSELGASGINIETPECGVQCHVPAGVGLSLDVRTDVGRGKNSFGIPIEKIPGKRFGLTMVGDVAGGGPPVKIRADVGNVSVRAHDVEPPR